MQELFKLQTRQVQILIKFYEDLKVVANLTDEFLDKRLEDVNGLWAKIDDTHSILLESTSYGFELDHDYFNTNQFDLAFCTYDACVMLICKYRNLTEKRRLTGICEIEDVLEFVERQKESLLSSFCQINQNLWKASKSNSKNDPICQELEPEAVLADCIETPLYFASAINQSLPTNFIRNFPIRIAAYNSMLFKFGLNRTSLSYSSNRRRRLEMIGNLFTKPLLSWWPAKRHSVAELTKMLVIGKPSNKLFAQI